MNTSNYSNASTLSYEEIITIMKYYETVLFTLRPLGEYFTANTLLREKFGVESYINSNKSLKTTSKDYYRETIESLFPELVDAYNKNILLCELNIYIPMFNNNISCKNVQNVCGYYKVPLSYAETSLINSLNHIFKFYIRNKNLKDYIDEAYLVASTHKIRLCVLRFKLDEEVYNRHKNSFVDLVEYINMYYNKYINRRNLTANGAIITGTNFTIHHNLFTSIKCKIITR